MSEKFSIEGAVDELVTDMPAPQPHVMESAQGEASAASEKPQGETDASGAFWDKTIHATGKDGKGTKTANGMWRRRKGLGSNRAPRLVTESAAPAQPVGPSAQEQSARVGGVGAANLLITAGVGLFGDEWRPQIDEARNLDEKKFLEQAFGDYFVAKGWGDLPPGLALATAIGFYALPRLHMPHTQRRVWGIGVWFRIKYLNIKLRRQGLKVVPLDTDENDPLGLRKYGYKIVSRTGRAPANLREVKPDTPKDAA